MTQFSHIIVPYETMPTPPLYTSILTNWWNSVKDGAEQTLQNEIEACIAWVHKHPAYATHLFSEAAHLGITTLVQGLLANPSVDVNKPMSDGPPLYYACMNGHKDVVALLIADPRVEVNFAVESGLPPFYRACASGHASIVALLLADPRVEVNKPDNDGQTPLFKACYESSLPHAIANRYAAIVALLLADPRVDVNKLDDGGKTPFYYACSYGLRDIVPLLLADSRVDVNKPGNYGKTPFFHACENNHKDVVALLLADPRVDINKPDNDGQTPFFSACVHYRKSVVEKLLADPRLDNTNIVSDLKKLIHYFQEVYQDISTWKAALLTEIIGMLSTYVEIPAESWNKLDDSQKQSIQEEAEAYRKENWPVRTFAELVFLCDGLLRVKADAQQSTVGPFFRIAAQLPMELQMVLCHRMVGSAGNRILNKDSEPAFRRLAQQLQQQPTPSPQPIQSATAIVNQGGIARE